jgi:formylglycine-generating enzyme required for sulfatase activity
MLSYDDAVVFCRKTTERMRALGLIEKEEVIRLPSEAEWEYAARAGTDTVYSFGDKEADLDAYAWHTGNAAGNDPPVGAKKPNPWGLYDVHGYLWELCSDAWNSTHEGSPTDGSPRPAKGDPKTTKFVMRSGSWKDKADQLTSTARRPVNRDTKDDALGLRCVLVKQ